jgi:hypothetical protein
VIIHFQRRVSSERLRGKDSREDAVLGLESGKGEE